MRIPRATYRVQLQRGFPLSQVRELVAYLDELGASDLYASPLLMARPGSTHGYDVTDPTRLDPELGTEADLAGLSGDLADRGMGLLLDIVPNHLCLATDNRWWRAVLAHGPDHEFSRYFDVFWQPTGHAGRYQVAIPILGRPLDDAIAQGELSLRQSDEQLWLVYYEHRFPLAPDSYPALASATASPMGTRSGPGATEAEQSEWRLDPDALRDLLSRQYYRLMHWRRTRETLGYRRFFDINELIGVRVEDPVVFDATHALLFEWLARGWVTGLRVDHIDGLRAPRAYLRTLQRTARFHCEQTGTAEPYVVVEKILGHDETLRPDWEAAGTTGYEVLNALCHVFIDVSGERAIRQGYAELTGCGLDADAVEADGRRFVLRHNLHGSVARLAERAAALWSPLGSRAPSREAITEAIVELLAHFRVYRTYLEPEDSGLGAEDARRLEVAAARARRALPNAHALDLLVPVLRADPIEGVDTSNARELALRFQQLSSTTAAKGFEDTTLYRWVPLLARNEVGGNLEGSEDPVARLHALGRARLQVGAHGLSTTATHDTKRGEDTRLRIALLSEMPEAWLEAVRRWTAHNAAHRSPVAGTGSFASVGEGRAPDANDEYLFYQTLVGALAPFPESPEAWRTLSERVAQYMEKACREAKRRTSWWDPNEAYEAAVQRFVLSVLDPEQNASFLDDVRALCEKLQSFKWASASQILLKVASPGVPDFYQGTELVDCSLVDPDNRRPVDFAARARLLTALRRDLEDNVALAVETWARRGDADRLKLFVTHRCLGARRAHHALFERGVYSPAAACGPRARHVVGFSRHHGGRAAIAIASRLHVGLGATHEPPDPAVWRETRLMLDAAAAPPGRYRDALTGQIVALGRQGTATACSASDALSLLPLSLLVGPVSPSGGP